MLRGSDIKIQTERVNTPDTGALCPHFGVCGGCSIQDKPVAEQLAFKERAVREALKDIPIAAFHPIRPSPDLFFYRNKMEFSFGSVWDRDALAGSPETSPRDEGAVHLGLHPKGRFGLVTPTPSCKLLSLESQRILSCVGEWASKSENPVYVRSKNKGVLRHLVVREGKNTGERLVNLIATSDLSGLEDLVGRLRDLGGTVTTFIRTVHDGLSDVARGGDQQVLWGEGTILERVGHIQIRVGPHTFMQTNTHAAEKMIALLKEWAGVGDVFLDLFCGTGAIGLNMADHFIQVIGVESEPASVESAQSNTQLNGIANFTARLGRVEDQTMIFKELKGRVDACVVDPPRAGLHPAAVHALAHSGTPRVLYVSCNPLTLARDLKKLHDAYQVTDVQPLDFFPHTDHVETAVRLSIR